MYHWTFSRPDLTEHLLAGRRARDNVVARLGSRIAIALARATQEIKRDHRRRQSIAALRSLDNHMLGDIGVSRSEIMAAVEGHLPYGRGRTATLHAWPSGVESGTRDSSQDLPKAA